MSRRLNDDDDDGLFDEANDDDDADDSEDDKAIDIGQKKTKKKPSKKRKADTKGGGGEKSKKSKAISSWIDDAAEESGDEGGGDDDDDEEDDDENENDYVKDGFVVDEDEEERERKTRKKGGDLEDSDDDDDDEDEDDDDDGKAPRKKRFKKSRVRKMRQLDMLAEEDLDLIREARGDREREDALAREREEARRKVLAKDEAELRKGLFYDSGEEDERASAPSKPSKRIVERYDEDGMDDFIDDDIGDQDHILASERRGGYDDEGGGGVSEAQLNEASEIFGTDYLEFMADQGGDQEEEELLGKENYRERGVGVDLGVDSEEDISEQDDDDDEDDLFGDDDAGDGVASVQKAEALKLKRQKRELARQERRKKALQKKNEKRKAQLRRAFEPVQLVENFCTERDDEIRRLDAPERLFEWNTPFHGSTGAEITLEEEEEALWIMGRIPAIAAEFFVDMEDEARQKSILDSIIRALRFLHIDKLEPAFIKRYRQDIITSPAVRESLYDIMDEDAEFDRMISARKKVEGVLISITTAAQSDEATGAEVQSLKKLEIDLKLAQEKLDETAKQESDIKVELDELGPADDNAADDDDDDELFGDDDDDDEVSIQKSRGVI